MIDGASVFGDQFAHVLVIALQDLHDFFGLHAFGKSGKPANITEQGHDVTAVAFEHRLLLFCQYNPGHFRGKKPFETRQFFDFLNLIANPLLQAFIQSCQFRGLVREQPGLSSNLVIQLHQARILIQQCGNDEQNVA